MTASFTIARPSRSAAPHHWLPVHRDHEQTTKKPTVHSGTEGNRCRLRGTTLLGSRRPEQLGDVSPQPAFGGAVTGANRQTLPLPWPAHVHHSRASSIPAAASHPRRLSEGGTYYSRSACVAFFGSPCRGRHGGDEGIRTPYLNTASVALSRLSYIPDTLPAYQVCLLSTRGSAWLAISRFGQPVCGHTPDERLRSGWRLHMLSCD